jgi:hypothetical protein
MIKHFLLFTALILSMHVIAQTGIGTTTPHASAKLEVASDRQGFLPPQVTLTSTTDNTTIKNAAGTAITPAVGLLVFNTATAGTSPNNVVPGYYYWNGSSWLRLIVPTDNLNNITGVVSITKGGTGTTTATGSGSVVLNNNPILTTPTLGVASGTSLALTGTISSTSTISGALTVAGGIGVAGQIYAGGIQNTPIGNTNASSGSFTTIVASGNITATGNLTGGNSSSSSISGFAANILSISADYPITSADNGKVIQSTGGTSITITIPNSLPNGFNCTVVQMGAGQITFARSPLTPTIINRTGFTKTASQYSVVSILHLGSNNILVTGEMSN